MEINDDLWARLRAAAVEAAACAYAPYSGYSVGAAALAEDGKIYTGCNVENASTGLGLCAECGLVSQAVRSGAGKLVAFTCVNGLGETISPCGRCRQLLREFGGHELILLMPSGVMTMDEVLPDSFGPDSMVGHTIGQPLEFAEGESCG